MTEFRPKIIDYGLLFAGITIGVSIFSGPRVNAGFVRAATAASSNCEGERSPWSKPTISPGRTSPLAYIVRSAWIQTNRRRVEIDNWC